MKEEIELAGPPYIFRYRPNNEFSLDELENNYIYFSDSGSLNDPFDLNPNLIKLTENKEELKEFYNLLNDNISDELTLSYFQRKVTPESLIIFIQQNIEKYIKRFGIACFSINPMNMPLWANYAGNNKGICLQFNAEMDIAFFSELRTVQYEKDLVQKEFNPKSDKNGIIDLFFRKQENWHYEFEVRLLKEFVGKSKFKKESLRNVIFGYQAEPDYINKGIKIIRKNYKHVKVYQMKKPTELNIISFIEL